MRNINDELDEYDARFSESNNSRDRNSTLSYESLNKYRRPKISSQNYKSNLKLLTVFDDSENCHSQVKPPVKISHLSQAHHSNHQEFISSNNRVKFSIKSEKENYRSNHNQDAYFRTSASSNEGFKSQYQSTNEAISVFSPKEAQYSNTSEDNARAELHQFPNLNSGPKTDDHKFSLLNNIKLLYDQSTDRSKKRLEQMKKIRNFRCTDDDDDDEEENNEEEFKDHHDEFIHKKEHNEGEVDLPRKIYFSHSNNLVTTKLTERVTESPASINKLSFDVEENNINNEDAEVMVSDLDCSVECIIDKNDKHENNTNKITYNAHKTFVPIVNHLVTKNAIKEDNATPSYLMALNQCQGNNNEENEGESGSLDINDLNVNENYDSLEKEIKVEKRRHKSNTEMELKHIRWPSLKNVPMMNSIIEEEVNETYTDSEISNKKKSFLFSKSKYESSEKKISISSSRDIHVEKNLDSIFFNSITGAGERGKVVTSANNLNDLITNTNLNSFPLSSNNHMPSKSEFDIQNTQSKKTTTGHKIAKSEIFNLQFDLKKTLDEISKKITEEDEISKQKVGNKKKELIDKFFNKSSNVNPSSFNCNKDKDKNKDNNVKRIFLKIQNVIDNVTNVNLSSPVLKKSRSGCTREQCYQDNSDKSKKLEKIDEENQNFSKLSKEDFEISLRPQENLFSGDDVLLTFSGTHNITNLNLNNNNNNNSVKVDKDNIYNLKKEKYKRERKKSSIFKSEDMRISRATDNNFVSPRIISQFPNTNIQISNTNFSKNFNNQTNQNNQSSMIDQCSYININNNFNICSPISVNSIKNDIIEYSIHSINDKKIWDKTLNPFDLMRNNSITNENYSNEKGTQCINLNLTISNRNDESSTFFIKRKLFEADNNSDKLSDNSEKIDNSSNKSNKSNIKNNQKQFTPMIISNEIQLDILHVPVAVTQNQNQNTILRNRKSSIDLLISNIKRNSIPTVQRHNKTASMNINILSNYKKDSNNGLNFNLNMNNLLKINNKDVKENKSIFKNNFFRDVIKGRSNSGSSHKQPSNTDFGQTSSNNTCHYTNTSPFSRNTKTERSVGSVKVTNSSNTSQRTQTPDSSKIKKTSDFKYLVNFSSNKKEKNTDKLSSTNTIDKNTINNNKENNSSNNLNRKYITHNNLPSNLPKAPKTIKPILSRTNSEIPISYLTSTTTKTTNTTNIITNNYSNKLKIFEALRCLNYQKTFNLDHHKITLEKLTRSKGSNFIILIDDKKGYVKFNINIFQDFRGVYELNKEKQLLLKVYSLNFCPNIINFNEISKHYSLSQNTLALIKQNNSTNDVISISPICMAITVIGRK